MYIHVQYICIALSLSLSHSHSLTHSLFSILIHTLIFSLSLSHIHPNTHSLTLTHASGLGDSMEVEGGGVSLPQLEERFSLEYTKLYMKIAAVARQQSNYAVCRKYLGLTETAINEVHKSFKIGRNY